MPKLHQAIEEYKGVDLTENSSMTLGEWMEKWLTEYAEPTLRPSTVNGYRNIVKNQRIQVRRAADDRSVTSRLSKTAALSQRQDCQGFLRPVSPCAALCAICCRKSGKYPTKPFAPFWAFFAVCEPCQNLRCVIKENCNVILCLEHMRW